MAVWFGPNHEIEFLDIGTIFRIVQDWVLKVDIPAGFGSGTVGKCMVDFVVFFRTVFGPSLRTASWLNL